MPSSIVQAAVHVAAAAAVAQEVADVVVEVGSRCGVVPGRPGALGRGLGQARRVAVPSRARGEHEHLARGRLITSSRQRRTSWESGVDGREGASWPGPGRASFLSASRAVSPLRGAGSHGFAPSLPGCGSAQRLCVVLDILSG